MAQSPALQRHWLRLGASARLSEIRAEVAQIYAMFPELRRGSSGGSDTVAALPGKKRSISPAGRKSMSAGMRRYWVRRKAREAAEAKASAKAAK